jgi:hypothetical protein
MVYKATTGSIYLPMCDITTGEFFKGRLFLYSKVVMAFVGTEEHPIRQLIDGRWITKKLSFPIFEFVKWENVAVQLGDVWIIPSEIFD